MFKFWFSVAWTALTLYLAIFALEGAALWERAIFYLFPLFGAVLIWMSWRYMRRRRSLRTETIDGVTVYIWIELNGQECRSTKDPTPDWDAAEGDDGDGDGGGD